MNILDYIYNEFIKFLEDNNVVASYDEGLISSKDFSLYDKRKVLEIMGERIIDHSFCWIDTPISNGSWDNLNDKWIKKFRNIFREEQFAKDVTEPITIYYTDSKYVIEKLDIYSNISAREEVRRIFSNGTFPEEIGTSYLIWEYSGNLLSWIRSFNNIPIKFEKFDEHNVIQTSSIFQAALEGFESRIEKVIFQTGSNLPLNYIDLDLNTGKVSYLLKDKIKEVPEDEYYTSSKRTTTTIGKLLVKLDTYHVIDKCDIERISNYFRGISRKINIEVLEGEGIKWAYLESNYAPENTCIRSTLHNSCMRYEGCQSYFDFYIAAHAKIAVLLNDHKKVESRALLWEVGPNKYYLDRIYSVTPFTNIRFVTALKTKYNIEYFRVDSKLYDANTFEEIKGGISKLEYVIQTEELKNYEGNFPYADSFIYYIKPLGLICTNSSVLLLHRTDGSSDSLL